MSDEGRGQGSKIADRLADSRRGIAGWIDGRALAALASPKDDPFLAVVTLGRLLRAGDLSGDDAAAATASFAGWGPAWPDAVGRASASLSVVVDCFARVARGEPDADGVLAAIQWRDDIESVLMAVGHPVIASAQADVIPLERGLREQTLDADAESGTAEWNLEALATASAPVAQQRWLSRIAPLEPGAWWLDLLERAHRPRRDKLLAKWRARTIREEDVKPLQLRIRPSADHVDPGVIACGQFETAEKRATLVGRMLEGEVEIFAEGLGKPGSGPTVLYVRPVDGARGRVEWAGLTTTVGPVAGIADGAAWWIALVRREGRADDLLVRYRGKGETMVREERLPLEQT